MFCHRVVFTEHIGGPTKSDPPEVSDFLDMLGPVNYGQEGYVQYWVLLDTSVEILDDDIQVMIGKRHSVDVDCVFWIRSIFILHKSLMFEKCRHLPRLFGNGIGSDR